MKRISLALIAVCLSLLLGAIAFAETKVSEAVRISVKKDSVSNKKDTGVTIRQQIFGPNFEYFSGNTWSHRWFSEDVVYYRVELRDSHDKIVESDGVYPSKTYPDDLYNESGLLYTFDWKTEIDTGFYTFSGTGYDRKGKPVETYYYQFYFRDNVWLYAPHSIDKFKNIYGYEPEFTRAYSSWGTIDLLIEPDVDWIQRKVTSKRYRVQIAAIKDPSAIDSKKGSSPILIDTYTDKPKYEIERAKLPVGQYTIRVWRYPHNDAFGDNPSVLHLTIRDPWYIYIYLLDGVSIIPGEAITRQHAIGSKDMTLYTAVRLETDGSPMTKLRLGGQTLEADCGGSQMTAAVAGDTLTLSSGGSAWRITQKALHTLKESGIRAVRFRLPDGGETRLPADLEFSGRTYGLLRASGLVSKDFALVWLDGAWAVEAEGATYDYDPASGELTEREAA